jgi:hypothetical protein
LHPIEKSRFGQIKSSICKQFYLVLFGWAWSGLEGFGRRGEPGRLIERKH